MFRERRWGWIGIDIGTRAVKIAQIERPAGRWRLARALILHDAHRNPLDELERPDDWLLPALRSRLTRQSGFRGHRGACVLSLSRTELRTLDLPDGSDGERRAMIAHELETGEESAGSAASFDYWESPLPAGNRREGGGRAVQVVSVAADLADRAGETLHRCGLTCEVLDALPTALARVAAVGERHADGPLGILDWGHTTATFLVTHHRMPIFTRELRGCGLEPLLHALARGLNLTPDEIEEFLVRYGFPAPSAPASPRSDLQRLAADLAAEPLRQLVDQLQKTLGYLRQQRTACVPTHIHLVGGGAAIANIAPLLSTRMRMPVDLWHIGGADPSAGTIPESLLAPAVALSALAWD